MKYKILVYNHGWFIRYFMATIIEVIEIMCEVDRTQKFYGFSSFYCGHYEYVLLGEVNINV